MIVPSRALIIVYTVAVPATVLAGSVFSGFRLISLSAVVLLAAVAAVDALTAPSSHKGLSFGIDRIIRMTRLMPGRIDLDIGCNLKSARALSIGLGLPPWIGAEKDIVSTVIPAGSARVRLGFSCIPVERGSHTIGECYVQGRSILGLWLYRKAYPLTGEIRVYPSLSAERKGLAQLFLRGGFQGMHRLNRTGKGREFEKLREYIPGDGFEDIHWKATAKRHQPVTKIYRLERTQDVYVVIDSSRLTARPVSAQTGDTGAPGDTVLERYVSAALVLGMAAQKQGDNFGLITFSDSIHGFLKAHSGSLHYGSCRELICSLRPRLVNPDFEELFTFIRLNLRKRALIIFLTCLGDPVLAEGFTRSISILSRTHLVSAGMIRPENARPLFSSPDIKDTDGIYSSLAGHYIWHNLAELNKSLARQGVGFNLYDGASLSAGLVNRYAEIKERQIL